MEGRVCKMERPELESNDASRARLSALGDGEGCFPGRSRATPSPPPPRFSSPRSAHWGRLTAGSSGLDLVAAELDEAERALACLCHQHGRAQAAAAAVRARGEVLFASRSGAGPALLEEARGREEEVRELEARLGLGEETVAALRLRVITAHARARPSLLTPGRDARAT